MGYTVYKLQDAYAFSPDGTLRHGFAEVCCENDSPGYQSTVVHAASASVLHEAVDNAPHSLMHGDARVVFWYDTGKITKKGRKKYVQLCYNVPLFDSAKAAWETRCAFYEQELHRMEDQLTAAQLRRDRAARLLHAARTQLKEIA